MVGWPDPRRIEGNLPPVLKKDNATEPDNWRTFYLLNCTYKTLAHIIANRMDPHVRDDGLEAQYSCPQEKGYANAVFPLKTTLQFQNEHSIESFVVSVDLVKTFTTVKWTNVPLFKKIWILTKNDWNDKKDV